MDSEAHSPKETTVSSQALGRVVYSFNGIVPSLDQIKKFPIHKGLLSFITWNWKREVTTAVVTLAPLSRVRQVREDHQSRLMDTLRILSAREHFSTNAPVNVLPINGITTDALV